MRPNQNIERMKLMKEDTTKSLFSMFQFFFPHALFICVLYIMLVLCVNFAEAVGAEGAGDKRRAEESQAGAIHV